MLFDTTYSQLGWPKSADIMRPLGAGPRLYSDLVGRKIGKPLQRYDPSASFRLGVLATDPASKTSDAPLALVCEFTRAASITGGVAKKQFPINDSVVLETKKKGGSS
jgi:hypothetical protein